MAQICVLVEYRFSMLEFHVLKNMHATIVYMYMYIVEWCALPFPQSMMEW